MNGNEIKLVTFADDMTTFVCDKPSHLTLIGVINLFGTHSGLKINHEKTEALLLGNKEVAVRNFMLHVPLDSIITSAEREVKDSRRSGMYQSCNFLTRLGKQSL